jgi:hypothetical protein
MRKNDLQYIADSLLIEKLSMMNRAINKTAFDLSALKSGLGEANQTIHNLVTQHLQTPTKESGHPILNLLDKLFVPAMLVRLGVPGMIILFLTSVVGVDLGSIVSSILDPIRPKIESGEQITDADLNAPVATVADVGKVSDAFYDLRKIVNDGNILKSASGYEPWYVKLFSFMGPSARGSVLRGFVFWVIKTVLLSAGLMAGAGALRKMFAQPQQPQQQQYGQIPQVIPDVTILQSSGYGEDENVNDAKSVWIVPLYGTVKNTLATWAVKVYPELKGHESQILSSPSFNRTANILEKNFDYHAPNYLSIPTGFTSIKEIVDTFAGDVASKIEQKGNYETI